jgi:spermidine synthase
MAPSTPPASPKLTVKLASLLATCSGLLAIGTEVLWVRALVLSFQGTVYIFALVLTAYLIGIGWGSLLLTLLRRWIKREIILLGLLYSFIAASCLAAMFLIPRFSGWTDQLQSAGQVKGWGEYILATGGMALLAMLPATLAMGASLPLLIGLADRPSRESRTAGTLYGLNTLGGIMGSLLATFGLMPWLGLSGALLAHAGGYLVLVSVLGFSGSISRFRWSVAVVPLILVILAATLRLYPEVNGSRDRVDSRLLFYRDAPSGTVGIYHSDQNITRLRVNNYYGLSDTSPETVRFQRRLGHLPMLIHPEPKRALLIGLATGTTLAAMSKYPLQRIDCVELHPTVIGVAPYFKSVNDSIWHQSNVHIQRGDGRRFLRRAGPAYDVIVGDLYLPSNAGVGALYSLEHFMAAKNRLARQGVFVAWLPLYQLAPEQVATITNTFLQVFPRAEGWMGHWGHRRPILGLVGWKSQLSPNVRPSAAAVERKIWELGIQEEGLDRRDRIQSRQLLTNRQLRNWAGNATLNTYDHPVIEYNAPRAIILSLILNEPLANRNHNVIRLLLQGNRD